MTLRNFYQKCYLAEIPENFEFDRALSEISVRTTENKYVCVNYQLNWLPDAYSDQGEWDGPGYGVHFIEVYDSVGTKIFSQKFDGYSEGYSVSEDGKYLFDISCLSPEWAENIKYRFSVTNILSTKLSYEELLENCKIHGGGGNYYPNFYKSNGNYIILKNNFIQGYAYVDSKLYSYLDKHKFEIQTKSKKELMLIFPDGKKEIVNMNTIYDLIKLD